MGWYYYGDSDYEEPPEPDPLPNAITIQGPIHAVSKRGDIGVEWWGRQWVEALGRIRDTGRLDRGKRYARNGSVRDMQIGHGIAFAHVSGSRASRYHSYVELKPLRDDQWERALQALSEQAIYSAKLLAGEMPGDIETIFEQQGASLFPQVRNDIQFDCSCPDWGDPCKHCAAVFYLLAEQLDADPFILFHLRGRTREQVIDQLRAYRGEDVASDGDTTEETTQYIAPPLDADLDAFWKGGSVDFVRQRPTKPARPFMFRQLGEPPGNTADEFRQVYDEVATEALYWLGLEDDDA
jgi:uncharacterized Zn finger protein